MKKVRQGAYDFEDCMEVKLYTLAATSRDP